MTTYNQTAHPNIPTGDRIELNWFRVEPAIVYPHCLESGAAQDCFTCELSGFCVSPRGLCVRPYPNHRKGCPNYGKKQGCPPDAHMFDQVFDMSKPVYAIWSKFNLASHVRRMQDRHPDWTERQLANCLYWQGTARKALKRQVEWFLQSDGKGYCVTYCPEAMGVNVTHTMKQLGIRLEWPPKSCAYQIALAAQSIQERRGIFQ